jgi:hypothetical protein
MKINTWRLFGIIGLIFMFVTIVTFAAGAARGAEPQEGPTIEEPATTLALTPEEQQLLESWFARRESEQLAEWAATQEASDRAWLAQEIAAVGSEPGEDSWSWSPCWPPEAMPWYPNDFPPPANWIGVGSGCR